MGPIEFALSLLLALTAYTFYKNQTMNMALAEREKMLPVVKEILAADSAPRELKLTAMVGFHAAADANFLPKIMRRVFITGSKRMESQPQPEPLTEHIELQKTLLGRHVYRVNMLAAPHWHAFFAAVFVLLFIFVSLFSLGKKSGYRFVKNFEEALVDTDCNNNNSYG